MTQPTHENAVPRAPRPGQGGFTLIEIMIALAILGTAMFVLLDAHYAALRLADDAWNKVLMRDLIERAVGQAQIEAMAGKESGEGDFGKRYPGYTYSYTATVDEKLDPGLYTINVSVQTPDGAHDIVYYAYDTTRGAGSSKGSSSSRRSSSGGKGSGRSSEEGSSGGRESGRGTSESGSSFMGDRGGGSFLGGS